MDEGKAPLLVAGDTAPPPETKKDGGAETPVKPDSSASGTGGALKTPGERRLGMALQLAQILAIVIGGPLAIYKFMVLDQPTLQKSLRTAGSLDWFESGR
jgi:hypothetical protein